MKYKTPDISGMYEIDYMPRKGKKEEIMKREEAINYLYSSGMSDEQVNAVVKALEQEDCEDAISRQAVIDSLRKRFSDGFDSDKWWNSTIVLWAINEVAPIQPVRPKGEWLTVELADAPRCIYKEVEVKVDKDGYVNDEVKCSVCGEWLAGSGEYRTKGNFCPNCGCRMEIEE